MSVAPEDMGSVVEIPTVMQGPDGSSLLVFRTYPGYDYLVEGETVNTISIDFGSPIAVENVIEDGINTVLPIIYNSGQDLLGYALFGGLTQTVSVPSQACIGSWCVAVPFGGGTLTTLNVYRLWMLTRPYPSASAMTARGDTLTQVGGIGIALVSLLGGGFWAVLAVLLVVGVVWLVQNGSVQWGPQVSSAPTSPGTPASKPGTTPSPYPANPRQPTGSSPALKSDITPVLIVAGIVGVVAIAVVVSSEGRG